MSNKERKVNLIKTMIVDINDESTKKYVNQLT